MKKSSGRTLTNRIKSVVNKLLGILVVVLVLAFIGYHLYSIAGFAKDFRTTTGISSR